MYDFNKRELETKIQRFIRNYNSEVFRWKQEGNINSDIDDFVNNEPSFLKWTDRLKEAMRKQQTLQFDAAKIRITLYRPFCKQFLYFDHLLIHRRYQQHLHYPTPATEKENISICAAGIGDRKGFGCFSTNLIVNLDLA